MNKKVLFGPAILAAILIVAAISTTPSTHATTQLTQENPNTQLYPVHMGQQGGYMPNQYGPYGGYQGYGGGQYGWGGCPGMNYGYYPYGQEYQYYPYGEEYPQPRYWNYTD